MDGRDRLGTCGTFWPMARPLDPPLPPPVGSYVTVRPPVPVGLGRVELAGRIVGGRGIRPRAPRRYPTHALMLVTGGTGGYRGVTGDAPLGPGSLVLVRPGEPHWYGPSPGAVWDEAYCAVTGPAFDLAARRGALGRDRVVAPADPARLQSLLERVRLAPPPTTTSAQDAEALDLLAALIGALAPADPETLTGGWLARSMHLLADEDDDVALTEVAAAVGMAYETWRRRFRAQVGIAPARYRRDARVRSSASLLRMTSLSVTEIAHRAGFVDDRHLARHFVRAFGVTPGRYRAAADHGSDGSEPGPTT